MSDLQNLYQELLLDHSRKPRNFGELDCECARAEGYNPLCGDEITVFLQMRDGVVSQVGFTGKGCAISTASASLMTESIKGKTTAEVAALFEQLHECVTAPLDAEIDPEPLGKLAALAGVRRFPMRVKCASLAWHTMRAAMSGDESVTTE